MKLDKNGRHISNGYIAELINKGFSIVQSEKGDIFLRLPIDEFTREFIKPTLPIIPKKPFQFEVNKFNQLSELLRTHNIGEQYQIAFAVLVTSISQTIKQNRLSKIDAEKTNELISRFKKWDLPKSVSVKYSKKDSFTLPKELIANFWLSFVNSCPPIETTNKVNIDFELSKTIYNMGLPKKNANLLIAELIDFAQDIPKTLNTPDAIRKRVKRHTGQNLK